MKTANEVRLQGLDGLRAISILLVLAAHLLPLGPKVLRFNETAGAMGMSLFFALSGFLITSGLIRNPRVGEFLIRRFARILPLVYAYTFVVLLIFSFNPRALLWTDLFIVNYLTDYLSTGWTEHLWSLCVEMQFYIAIAVVVLIGGKRALWLTWLACLAVTLVRIQADAYIAIETHLRVDEILSGACVATVFRKDLIFNRVAMLMTISAALWAITSWPLAGPMQYFRPYATALLLFVTMQYVAINKNTFLASRPMQYIATISYALYVLHPATAHGWMNEGNPAIKYLVKRPISFALTFLLAHFSTFHWERRWQEAAKRWIKRRRSEPDETAIASSTS